jgi:hypothetical protein
VDFKQIVDAVSTLGTLGFALLAVYAFLSRKLVTMGELEEAQKTILYERTQKEHAIELARQAIASGDRLADAVEARNQLETVREQAAREVRK